MITFYSGADIPVFLLNVFAKNDKTDLTAKERNTLKGGSLEFGERVQSKEQKAMKKKKPTAG